MKRKAYLSLGHHFLTYLKGEGGGDKGYFFVKLDFEIAVDQQTKTVDPTFGGGPGLRPPTGARGAATPIFGPILANHLKMAKAQILCTLLEFCRANFEIWPPNFF